MKDSREKYSDELARLLQKSSGLRVAQLLQFTGLATSPKVSAEDSVQRVTARETGPRPISIWEPVNDDGPMRFERPEPGPFGDHYAATRSIPAVKPDGVQRICLLGESVAAGYLYAPYLTPAKVLSEQLKQMSDADEHEVIDLARTNESLSGLANTFSASLQLNPDLVVIFAGNNWGLLEMPEASAYAPTAEGRREYAAHLRGNGFNGVIDETGKKLARKISHTFIHIGELAKNNNVQVMLVIPEVNLIDWQSRQPVVWLEDNKLGRWWALYQSAVKHLEEKQWERVEKTAHAMLDLDGGGCPTTYRLLAEARLGAGRHDAALKALSAEVDSLYCATLCFIDAPRAGSLAKRLQRRACLEHGFLSVDLEQVFREEKGLPDRRWFVDYCHLTPEGMTRAMGAVAQAILVHQGRESSGSDLSISLPAREEALALFGAAVHSAHRLLSLGSKRALLQHWCERSLKVWPEIAETMIDFISARCKGLDAVLAEPSFEGRPVLNPQQGWFYDYLDIDVILAVRGAFSARNDLGLVSRVDRILEETQGVDEAFRSLLPYALWEPHEQVFAEILEYDDVTRRAYFRSVWPETRFCLVVDQKRTVECEFTLRLPDPLHRGERYGKVIIRVNGVEIETLFCGSGWERQRVEIDVDHLQDGANELSILWPTPDVDGSDVIERIAERLENGQDADIHPIFGEIFEGKARLI